MMVNLVTYFTISTIIAAASIYHSYSLHEQFYPTVVYLTHNKLCILSLGNFGFCLASTIAKLILRIFFVEMADDETNEIMSRMKYSITEICIALTLFRNDLNKTVIMLFVILLFVKAFHWLSSLRMEQFARGQEGINENNTKCRLFFTLIFLLFIDFLSVIILLYILYQQQRSTVIVLFAFEFTILLCFIASEIGKFFVLLIDQNYAGRWSYKPTVMFILEFLHDLTHLGLYSIFIWILTTNFGFPLYLLRELFLAFHTLRKRIIQFYNYRKIIKVLDTQFPTITRQQLIDSDRDLICVICFSEMDMGKELPCKHVFHLNCLKRWFEQKQECPMDRMKIIPNQIPINNNNNNNNNNPVNNNEQKDNNNDDDDTDDDNDDEANQHIHPYGNFNVPVHQYYEMPKPVSGTPINSPNNTEQKHDVMPNTYNNSAYAYGYGAGYGSYYQYPYQQYYSGGSGGGSMGTGDATTDLQQLTRVTQRQIEYHEMCVETLRKSLEQYMEMQQKWKKEDENVE